MSSVSDVQRSLRLLEMPVSRLPGVGPARTHGLEESGIRTLGDLLRYIPRRYLDRSAMPPIRELRRSAPDEEKRELTIIGRISNLATIPRGRRRTNMTIEDGSGKLECVWFGRQDWLERVYNTGEEVAVSGELGWFRSTPQMTHPDIERVDDDEELLHMGRVVPIYPQTGALVEARLNARGMRRLVRRVLDHLGTLTDHLPDESRQRCDLLTLEDAFRAAHFPADIETAEQARRRLVFDEFLGLELALMGRVAQRVSAEGGISCPEVGPTFERLLKRLPFDLTGGQKQVLREIRRDMKRPVAMSRLLQGDVGSGKTLVALFAAVMASDNGYQVAIMAPTEVLAEQHAITMGRLLFEVGVDSVLITGSTPAAQRKRALDEVASGQVPVLIGTHSLLSDDARFHKLGLVVVDEQHRFGVLQREALRRKAQPVPDLLVMTATPIPRSLAQTLYGDLDVSVLAEKPPGRIPIVTRGVTQKRAETAWKSVREAVARGEQAYVVFPLIDKSEAVDVRAATEGFEELRTGPLAECRVAMLHGRMSATERDQTMQSFKSGGVDVLVCTTVIEVGVDVPNATIMVIEGAERFGLAQLHQLRGRIGRGTRPSTCFLMATGDLTPEAKKRLRAAVDIDDGFRLAEVDLEIRGPGEFFGTRQSGLPEFSLGHIVRDADILHTARDEAQLLIDTDPTLGLPEHVGLKALAAPFSAVLNSEDESTVA
jgi:ATP-dependent DNA helicase RecG